MSKTLYELLGVTPDARTERIKEAYLAQLARLRGTNHGLSAEDVAIRLKALEEAFSILNDAAQRAMYDFKLKEREMEPAVHTSQRSMLPWVLLIAIGILISLGRYWYVRSEERAQAQRELIQARSQAELAADQERQAANRTTYEQANLERQQKWEEERKQQQAKQDLERVKREVEYNHEVQARQRQAEEQAKQYQAQREDAERRRQEERERWARNQERMKLGLQPLHGRDD